MQHRLGDLDDEEAREIAAIVERYAEVKPRPLRRLWCSR